MLGAAACADRGAMPTGPSPSAVVASLPASGAEGRTPITEQAQGEVPFHGSLEATDVDTVSFPFLSVHLTGRGNATLLGTYAATFDFRVDLRTPTVPALGTFTLTSADGDSIFGDLVGRATIAGGIATVVETATVTGGTGRFARVTGGFTVERTVVQATGISVGSFDGRVDVHN
jgi:hypothetical protein